MPRSVSFGELLSEGIVSVSRRRSMTVKAVEDEIAENLSFARYTVERWRRGYVPREPEQIAFLVNYCVTHGRVDYTWAESLLIHACYFDRETLLKQIVRTIPQRPTPSVVRTNVPSRHGIFLGRASAMEDVLRMLASRYPIITIEGMGGVGKTTLATEVAHHYLASRDNQPDQPFEAIIWISAKSRPEKKLWLNEVLDTVARVLEHLNVTQMEPEQKRFEINQLLRTHRSLIIVDNFEVTTQVG
jgi:hypothetical protein